MPAGKSIVSGGRIPSPTPPSRYYRRIKQSFILERYRFNFNPLKGADVKVEEG